jgi:hypothetical protein
MGQAFEVAQQDRRLKPSGKLADFVGHGCLESRAVGRNEHGWLARWAIDLIKPTLLTRPPASTICPRTPRDARGNAKEPSAERPLKPDVCGPPHEHEKRGLKGILGIVRADQKAPADSENHRPVPLDQDREGHLRARIATADKPIQKLPV